MNKYWTGILVERRSGSSMLLTILSSILIAFIAMAGEAEARTFGGYECTDDCSGHQAGFLWAEENAVDDEQVCEDVYEKYPNRQSFYEGCQVYVQDPGRGADEDDDGKPVGQGVDDGSFDGGSDEGNDDRSDDSGDQ